jgi:hypothetical protein
MVKEMAITDKTFERSASESKAKTKAGRVDKAYADIKSQIKDAVADMNTSVTIDMSTISYFITYRSSVFSKITEDGYTYTLNHKVIRDTNEEPITTDAETLAVYNAIYVLINNALNNDKYTVTFNEPDIKNLYKHASVVKKLLENDKITVSIKAITTKNTTTGATIKINQWTLNLRAYYNVNNIVTVINTMADDLVKEYISTISAEVTYLDSIGNFTKYQKDVIDQLKKIGYTSIKVVDVSTTVGGETLKHKQLRLSYPYLHECAINWPSKPPEDVDPDDYTDAQKEAADLVKNIDLYFSAIFENIKKLVDRTSEAGENTCTYKCTEPFITNIDYVNEVIDKIKAQNYTVTTETTTDKETKAIVARTITVSW